MLLMVSEDEVGFVYPEIDQNLCIGCGACKKACGYQMQPMMQKSEAVYAAASNDDNLLRKSASGGAFAVLAENVLKKGGVVYGAALPLESGKLEPKHLRIDTVERLPELQGSKYVQSVIGDTYAQAKKDLLDGKSVLFSGTPCQIAGLKQYLKKDYEIRTFSKAESFAKSVEKNWFVVGKVMVRCIFTVHLAMFPSQRKTSGTALTRSCTSGWKNTVICRSWYGKALEKANSNQKK